MGQWLTTLLFLLPLLPLHAQYERMGGVYYAYPVTQTLLDKAPVGYEPFYISHYGRHGSRWVTSDERYLWVNRHFEDRSNLTPLGKSVRSRLARIWKNAKGNGGRLTPLGGRQHRDIARRMYHNFPQVFTPKSHVTARSSTADRCRASMLNFLDELQKAAGLPPIEPVTRKEDMAWIAYASPEQLALENRIKIPLKFTPDRFVKALFIDVSKIEDPEKLVKEIHYIASDMQDVELDISLYDIFTPAEFEAVYDWNNERMTLANGNNPQNEGIPDRSAVSLWQRIEADADAAIARGGVGADLRFGHDTSLYRLLTLMQVDTSRMPMDELLPMAANLQLIFYRNAQGHVVLQMLHNEHTLGFRSWDELKRQVGERIHHLEHLRQLNALHTMVGTAPANTRSAGLFGKGSEEHGQTLPAVLAPNGQTFWTPQTRDTEKKCVAPYYYTDSLLQGIRASHWIVGGCTQDYGSFTLAALTGQLRLKPTERATPFSHADEISHPHYYAVRLPAEHLKLELTGSSHTALLRITPERDGPVHIVVNPNSDEGQGHIEVDTTLRRVYGRNPVHRIYQGWGQSAGFSGHFVLDYTAALLDFGTDSTSVWLTFKGHAHEPILLRAATSFTSEEGARRNLEAEAAGLSFDEMAEKLSCQWIRRLHTIDAEDPDTARINRFYGALYRASFLPREMSDVDGKYPQFANGNIVEGGNRTFYGDFSIWDTYRALHPLYTLIAPSETADMMQSLVTMYTQGGWMPVFPCWNSYTAAMIGDHCSSVIADAYVKGIRNFDARKAYEGMLKNAMESPKTDSAYRDGMGRRALKNYLRYGFVPLEDPVNEAFHTEEQTSRTLEYAYDDFCVAQMARTLGHLSNYQILMARSTNWRNVINPHTGYADGRHADGRWENNTDLTHRKNYITEGATCHYTWYVPHDIPGLMEVLGGRQRFVAKLDSMFSEGRYWHGNEPCHQIPWLYAMAGEPEKTCSTVQHILDTEYNDSPGGLSGNDDAGQMSAWQLFAMMGFYPVCPATTQYWLAAPLFRRITLHAGPTPFVIERSDLSPAGTVLLNGRRLQQPAINHSDIVKGGRLTYGSASNTRHSP